MTFEEKLAEMSNDKLLEEYSCFCIACYEQPDDIGHDSIKYDIECELLKRMTAK